MLVPRIKEVCLSAGISVAALAVTLLVGAQAEPNVAPPDFASSGDMAWYHDGVNLAPVPNFPGPLRDDPVHRHTDNQGGGQANYSIADLSDPNLTQWAKDIMKKDNDEVLAGKIAFLPHQSCVPAGASMFDMVRGPIPIYFVQSPKEVLIIWPGDHQVRHIYLNVPHSPKPKPSWYGESVGHYEGDWLVVDTIAQDTRTFIDNFRTPHSDKLHVVERYHLINGGNMLEAEVTIEDPAAFKTPVRLQMRARKAQAPDGIIESRCADGESFNPFGQKEEPIPIAAKPDF